MRGHQASQYLGREYEHVNKDGGACSKDAFEYAQQEAVHTEGI
jgi:hypothetical protein